MSSESNVLRVGLPTSISSLDPRVCRDTISLMVVSAVYETPYRPPDEMGPAEPYLFDGPLETVQDGPDRWIYAGRLREGVQFSDGTPLTPELAVGSLNRGTLGGTPVRVSAEGDQILFELERRSPRFDLSLSLAESSLVLEKDGELLGTGPFVVEEFGREQIRLARNERYRTPVAIDQIEFQVYPEDEDGGHSALVDAVRTGEIDLTNCLSRGEVTPLTGVCKKFLPSTSTAILYLNTERPAMRDRKVRQAILKAIDRRAATGVCHTNVLAFAAQSLLPPSMGVARDNIRHDLEGARALIREAGDAVPEGLKMLIVWARRPYLPEPRAVGDLISRQIGELGIRVEIEPGTGVDGKAQAMTTSEFFDRLERGDYDATLVGWIADTPDPADFLDSCLSSGSVLHPGKEGVSNMNLSRWSDPQTDAALAAFREEPSFSTESAVLSIIADQGLLLPIMYGPSIVVHAWRVKGLSIRIDGLPRYDSLDLGKA